MQCRCLFVSGGNIGLDKVAEFHCIGWPNNIALEILQVAAFHCTGWQHHVASSTMWSLRQTPGKLAVDSMGYYPAAGTRELAAKPVGNRMQMWRAEDASSVGQSSGG